MYKCVLLTTFDRKGNILKEVKLPVQGHTASKGWSQDLNTNGFQSFCS